MSTPIQLIGGLAGAIGSDFRQAQNQLLFVEYGGKLSRLNLYRTGSIVSSGNGVLNGTWLADFDAGVLNNTGGGNDVWWEQQTAVVRDMRPQGGALLVNLGVVNFNTITPDTLASLTYSSTPIVGNNDASNKLVNGDVFAVRTTSGNYAKVKVVAYGYNIQLQWVTYQLDSPYAVLGTGYSEPEDVQASSDGAHAYVTERSGDLVRIALTNANRANATVIASGMTAPQQLFLDESHGAAYVVEYAPSGSLWHIDLSTGTKTALLSSLENAVGLILSADRQYAYISEQTSGADQGRVSRFQLSNGVREPIVTGLTAPFFLQWLDPDETTLLVPERDPANRITAVNVTSKTSNVAADGLAVRPSSVALTMPGQILVCCNDVIQQVDLSPNVFQPSGPLLMGVGFIPFDRIVAGLADTTPDPAYFYQVHQTPFGGSLPLMINHMRAYGDGARYYRVKVDGIVHTDQWTDYKWNNVAYIATNNSTVSVGGNAGYYRVRSINELFLWLNPGLGDLLDSTVLADGLHTITVEFVNSAGMLIESSTPLVIHVDNSHCTATIQTPSLPSGTADPHCGLLHYGTKDATPVTMPFTASHPHGFANFSFSLIKGVNAIALPAVPPTSGPVSAVVSPIQATVQDLMGKCDVAGFAESVYVAATANNGWSRQSQYDASAAIAFVLAP